MQKAVILVVTLAAVLELGVALRAFPEESKDMALNLFQRINPGIQQDDTNFLVDTAGPYARCDFLHQDGSFTVTSRDPSGSSIGGLRDTYPGEEAHWGAVKTYLANAMQHWIRDEPYRSQIQSATRYGCSVQPGCRDPQGFGRQISIACVFTPAYRDQGEQGDAGGDIRARAFTPDQYSVAEAILKTDWDRSYRLENLSGRYTQCAMIHSQNLPMPDMTNSEEDEMKSLGKISGSHPNLGDTQRGMEEIMFSWDKDTVKKMSKAKGAEIGCSVIPDCMYGGEMFVVVSCLYTQ